MKLFLLVLFSILKVILKVKSPRVHVLEEDHRDGLLVNIFGENRDFLENRDEFH